MKCKLVWSCMLEVIIFLNVSAKGAPTLQQVPRGKSYTYIFIFDAFTSRCQKHEWHQYESYGDKYLQNSTEMKPAFGTWIRKWNLQLLSSQRLVCNKKHIFVPASGYCDNKFSLAVKSHDASNLSQLKCQHQYP